ncbi:MAG: YIP1 family protein [Holophagales bacterium]|jgi:hypothetical protein|nr:YIP1 family protein [Holophagales bacterium]
MSDEPRRSLYGDADAKSAEDIKPLGMMDILSGVFSEPVELFQRLSKNPQWIGALVILTVSAILLTLAWAYRVDAVDYLMDQMERVGGAQLAKLSEADIERVVEIQARLLGPMSAISVLFMTPIVVFFSGLIWWGIGLMSREDQNWRPTYMHGLVAAAVPGLVAVPYYIIGALMAILKPVGMLRPDQIIPSSLGFWLQTDNIKLSVLYGKIDIFLLAGYVMLFFAMRHTLRAKPWGAALCVVLSLAMAASSVLFAK